MAIGVSYEEYWYKDPTRLKDYLKADEIRQKRKNNDLWLQGYYEYIAFCSVSPVLHAFAKKGTKPIPYLKQPITATSEDKEELEKLKRNERLLGLKQKLMASVKNNKEVAKE